MGRSSRPRASSQRPIARAASVVTCACHSSALMGSAKRGHLLDSEQRGQLQAACRAGLQALTTRVQPVRRRVLTVPMQVLSAQAPRQLAADAVTAVPGRFRLP